MKFLETRKKRFVAVRLEKESRKNH